MAHFSPGDRVMTTSGNMSGTVVEQIGDVIELEWDADADGGPYGDEVHASCVCSA